MQSIKNFKHSDPNLASLPGYDRREYYDPFPPASLLDTEDTPWYSMDHPAPSGGIMTNRGNKLHPAARTARRGRMPGWSLLLPTSTEVDEFRAAKRIKFDCGPALSLVPTNGDFDPNPDFPDELPAQAVLPRIPRDPVEILCSPFTANTFTAKESMLPSLALSTIGLIEADMPSAKTLARICTVLKGDELNWELPHIVPNVLKKPREAINGVAGATTVHSQSGAANQAKDVDGQNRKDSEDIIIPSAFDTPAATVVPPDVAPTSAAELASRAEETAPVPVSASVESISAKGIEDKQIEDVNKMDIDIDQLKEPEVKLQTNSEEPQPPTIVPVPSNEGADDDETIVIPPADSQATLDARQLKALEMPSRDGTVDIPGSRSTSPEIAISATQSKTRTDKARQRLAHDDRQTSNSYQEGPTDIDEDAAEAAANRLDDDDENDPLTAEWNRSPSPETAINQNRLMQPHHFVESLFVSPTSVILPAFPSAPNALPAQHIFSPPDQQVLLYASLAEMQRLYADCLEYQNRLREITDGVLGVERRRKGLTSIIRLFAAECLENESGHDT